MRKKPNKKDLEILAVMRAAANENGVTPKLTFEEIAERAGMTKGAAVMGLRVLVNAKMIEPVWDWAFPVGNHRKFGRLEYRWGYFFPEVTTYLNEWLESRQRMAKL